MGEHQISVGSATYPLPRLFLVMATQNPIEHAGTSPLPEAQLDRFMLHALVDYPDRAPTLRIMAMNRRAALSAQALPAPASKPLQDTVRSEELSIGKRLLSKVSARWTRDPKKQKQK